MSSKTTDIILFRKITKWLQVAKKPKVKKLFFIFGSKLSIKFKNVQPVRPFCNTLYLDFGRNKLSNWCYLCR